MKILKQGRTAQTKILALKHTCNACGTVYRLEEGDAYERSYDQREGDAVVSTCPVCEKRVYTEFSDGRDDYPYN